MVRQASLIAFEMLGSKALFSIKDVLPRLHHPLPLSHREAQRLLNALKSSFRDHLDREHGWLHDNAPPASAAGPAPTRHPQNDAHLRPTDRHLRAILSNPLFSYDSAPAQNAQAGRKRDPLSVFDEAVAKGLMTRRRATGCLNAVYNEAIQSPAPSVHEALAPTGAGLKVVKWLRASGQERDLSFTSDAAFVGILIQFMVAEGLEDLGWTWVGRLMRGEGPAARSEHAHPATVAISALVSSRPLGQRDLDAGYATLSRGRDMFHASSAFVPAFHPAWRRLASISTVGAWDMSPPSEALYDEFLDVGERLRIPPKGIHRAHLDLHHPTKPSADLAVPLLHHSALWDKLKQPMLLAGGYPRKVFSLGLDTVQHLANQGKMDEAQSILALLKDGFGEHYSEGSSEIPRHLAMG